MIAVDTPPLCGRDPEFSADPVLGACRYCPYMLLGSSCECFLPFLGDDGPGASVSIPSMMIARADGATYLPQASNPNVVLTATMRWDIPVNGELVQYSVW